MGAARKLVSIWYGLSVNVLPLTRASDAGFAKCQPGAAPWMTVVSG